MKIKTPTILILTIFVASIGAFSLAQGQQPQKPSGADEASLSTGQGSIRKTRLTRDQERQLRSSISQARRVTCPGPFPLPIAVSVYGNGHFTSGLDVLLTYKNVITNEGGAWSTSTASHFVAPCAGLYFFTISFVKDAYYHGGTTDDVNVFLTKNLTTIVGQAWSGEGAGSRGTGVYSVTLRLNQGDAVQTFVHSDGGPMRHLADYNFTGYRIGN